VESSTETVDLARPWRLSPQVSVRPEAFGALVYHFGTRRLSFLKSRQLLEVVTSLAHQPSAVDACRAVGVSEADRPRVERALRTLARTGMIQPRDER
jgi:mycofactocin biosynthesis protein MftB